MRHSDAGLAITDFPLSYGHLLPPSSDEGLFAVNELRFSQSLPPVTMGQVWIHFAHRLGALLTAITVLSFVFHILRTYPTQKEMREPALVTGGLVLVQFLLGALTVWTGKGVEITTTHVATGALLLASCVFLLMRSYHLLKEPDEVPELTTIPQFVRP